MFGLGGLFSPNPLGMVGGPALGGQLQVQLDALRVGQRLGMLGIPPARATDKPRESEAIHCFLKNLYRIKRALENDEGWTISEARVPGWLVDDLRKHPWLRRSDRRWCESRQVFQVDDEICRFMGVPLIVGTDRIEFSYKKVA